MLGFLLVAIPWSAHPQNAGPKVAISRDSLCVTEGAIEKGSKDRLSVSSPKMRAYVNGWTSQAIEAHFTYLGPTAEESRLGSGETRRQFGLKLQAQDACNLVYAMWRFEPESKLVVSIKRNPSQTKSSECGNHGYQNIKPRHMAPVPTVRPSASHNLAARLDGEDLRVLVDNVEVWQGSIGPDAHGLKGPVGIRSDNVQLAFDLKAGAYDGVHPDYVLTCKSGPDAAE